MTPNRCDGDGRRHLPWTRVRPQRRQRNRKLREAIMNHWAVGLLLLAASPAYAQQTVPSIAFDSVPNPLRLPANMYFGEVSGISLNSKGHIFVMSRGNTSGPAYAAA